MYQQLGSFLKAHLDLVPIFNRNRDAEPKNRMLYDVTGSVPVMS